MLVYENSELDIIDLPWQLNLPLELKNIDLNCIFLYKSLHDQDESKLRFRIVVEYLVFRKVDLNAKDKDGKTPLHYAALRNNEIGAEILMKERDVFIEVYIFIDFSPC